MAGPRCARSSSAAASERVNVGDLHRADSPSGSRSAERNGLLAAAADLQPVAQRCPAEIASGAVWQSTTVSRTTSSAPRQPCDDAVALHALEARRAGIDAALRAHVDDVLEVASRSAPPAPPRRCCSAKLRTRIISWHTPAQMKRERVMCSVPRGSTIRPPSPRTSGLVRLTVSSTLSSRAARGQQQRSQAGDGQRESRQVAHAGAIQASLAARLGVDVADLVEQAEAVVVPQRVGALARSARRR